MRISINQLKKYINLPKNWQEIRDYMEDAGLEVKNVEVTNNDVIFSLELLANRGDHHSYIGVARELHGRTNWALLKVDYQDIPAHEDKTLASVHADSCLNYTLTEFILADKSQKKSLPQEVKDVVELSGTNIILPVVDITNYISAELGQPTHVFDADKIDGHIVVRESKVGESAHLLFTQERTLLPEGTLVIADESKVLAIAGIMGCEEAKPTIETKRIYIESATFDPVKIRKTSKLLKLQSHASIRFERGTDPELAINSIKRANVFFSMLDWKVQGPIRISKKWDYKKHSIALSTNDLCQYFDINLGSLEIETILNRYGFQVSKLNTGDLLEIEVPSHRIWDVREACDIYEEVAKGLGYNSLPSVMPPLSYGSLPPQLMQRMELVEQVLVGEGFFEVFTDAFYSEKNLERAEINEEHPLWDHVTVANATNRAYSLLKNNALIQALELVQTNLHVKNSNIKAFEWTRIFQPSKQAENGLGLELPILWMIVSGESRPKTWQENGKVVDVFYLKGIIDKIANALSIPLKIRISDNERNLVPLETLLHPKRRAVIEINGKNVGVLGEIHPTVLSSYGIKNARPCFIQLSQEILDIAPLDTKYVPPASLNNFVTRDTCLLLPKGLFAGEIVEYMKGQSDWIDSIKISDLFNSEATNNNNAVTFSITYSLQKAQKDNFIGEEINIKTEELVRKCIDNFKEYKIERR